MGGGKRSGTCRICLTEGALTREDVIPEWLRKEYKRFSPPGLDLPPRTILPICGPCNALYSRLFENVAAPVFRKVMWSPTAHLVGDDAVVIARWIAKTDALLALYRAETGVTGHRVPAQDEADGLRMLLTQLCESEGLPDGILVRAARVDDRRFADRRPLRLPAFEVPPNPLWTHSISPTGKVITESILAWGDSIDLTGIEEAWRDDRRLAVIGRDPEPGRLPPIHSSAIFRMRTEYGHAPDNHVNKGWYLRS